MKRHVTALSLVVLAQSSAWLAGCSDDVADDGADLLDAADSGALADGSSDDARVDTRADADFDEVGADATRDVEPDVWVDQRAAVVPEGNPAEMGPWAVGMTTFELPGFEEFDDPIGVEVWYPAAAEGDELAVYRALLIDVPSIAAYRDAPPDPTAPAFLVAFSHGLYGIRQQNFTMAERLASWGFVVVSADHPGTTTLDLLNNGKLEEALLRRPGTIRLAVDSVFDGIVPGLVPRDGGIAMVGHSLGAVTAMFVAGAVISPDRYREGCTAEPRPEECNMIGTIRATAEEIAATARADERVVTTILQNPAGFFAFEPESLTNIPSPLFMGGELDGLGTGSVALFELLNDDAALVVYTGGGHNGPTDICNIDLASSFSPDCSWEENGFAEPAALRERTVEHVVAWLGVHLGGQPAFGEYLGEGSGFVWTE